jgi:hypothetical protein
MQQRTRETQSPAGIGRFFRLLVGDTVHDQDADIIDVSQPGSVDMEHLELRIRRLERSLRVVADAVKRSHAELSETLRSMQADSRERERVTRAEMQRMLWEAMGPVAASVEHLSEAIGILSSEMTTATEQLLSREYPAITAASDALEPSDSPVEPATPPPPEAEAEAEAILPAQPFDLEPLESSEEAPASPAENEGNGTGTGTEEKRRWFWSLRNTPN